MPYAGFITPLEFASDPTIGRPKRNKKKSKQARASRRHNRK